MKYILKANEKVDSHYGDVHLEATEGESVEMSPREAEIALSTGKFEFVKEITESESDEVLLQNQRAELEARKSELMELGKEELAEQAKDLEGYKSSMKKEGLVELILKPRAAVTISGQTNPPDGDDKSA